MKKIKITTLSNKSKLKILTEDAEYNITTTQKGTQAVYIDCFPLERVILNGSWISNEKILLGWIVVGCPLDILRYETLKPPLITSKVVKIEKKRRIKKKSGTTRN